MTSSSAERITHPAELWLPSRLERADEVFASLTPSGRAQFISEFVQALYEARSTDNLRPLQDVVEKWYRTLVARRSPDYEAGVAWARDEMRGEMSEARRRALEASVAPGADIDLTYEEAQELWASVREGTASHPGVITMESDITSIVFQRGHFEGSVETTSSFVTVRP